MFNSKSSKLLSCSLLCILLITCVYPKSNQFKAVGPIEPIRMEPRKKGAVKVYFDLLPTSMSFNLPSHPCRVTENNIEFTNSFAETYEQRIGGGSFETLQDRENFYSRMWIESQNDARIIIRARGALCDREGRIAHTDIPSGSPYGKGDWVDEWYYIYPDGTYLRHVKIYTGLAPRSRPFGFDRGLPRVVHEFMEAILFGAEGQMPSDIIETEPLTLIRIMGKHIEGIVKPEGKSKRISFEPYPEHFGDFRDANIMVVNLKSKYKPYTIALPWGVIIQPYWPTMEWKYGDPIPDVFKIWGNPPETRWTTPLGHILNYWHYRRTDNTLEQIYLSGMTKEKNPKDELVPLAWSWIYAPQLKMEGVEPDYAITYDQTQRAYEVPCEKRGPREIEFSLSEGWVPWAGHAFRLVNPVFIVKKWGEGDVEVKFNGRRLKRGKEYRVGYEKRPIGTNMVIWTNFKSEEPVTVSISPAND